MDAIETIEVVIETPAGSRNKYELDPETGVIRLSRRMRVAARFPVDYGYIPETLGLDGDPLDAMVLTIEPVVVGCRVTARPIGVLRMRDEHGSDDKVLFVPSNDPVYEGLTDVGDVPAVQRQEIQEFFETYKDLEPGTPVVGGWGTRTEAIVEIEEARSRRGTGD